MHRVERVSCAVHNDGSSRWNRIGKKCLHLLIYRKWRTKADISVKGCVIRGKTNANKQTNDEKKCFVLSCTTMRPQSGRSIAMSGARCPGTSDLRSAADPIRSDPSPCPWLVTTDADIQRSSGQPRLLTWIQFNLHDQNILYRNS